MTLLKPNKAVVVTSSSWVIVPALKCQHASLTETSELVIWIIGGVLGLALSAVFPPASSSC